MLTFFIFWKKKEKTWREMLAEFEKKYGVPADYLDILDHGLVGYGGYIEFVRRMDPENDIEKEKRYSTLQESLRRHSQLVNINTMSIQQSTGTQNAGATTYCTGRLQ